jgi:hypothetical protein
MAFVIGVDHLGRHRVAEETSGTAERPRAPRAPAAFSSLPRADAPRVEPAIRPETSGTRRRSLPADAQHLDLLVVLERRPFARVHVHRDRRRRLSAIQPM